MRAFFSYFIAVVIALVSLAVIPVDRLFDEIINTKKVVGSVMSANLYGQLSRMIAQKMIDQNALRQISKTPLMPTEDEILGVLQKSFSEEWFLNNTSAAHAQLISCMADPVPQGSHFVGMVLADRKNLLTENLTLLVKMKMESLPECTLPDFIRMNSIIPRNGNGLEMDLGKFDFHCKPPERLQNLILKSIQKRSDSIVNVLPDTLYWLKSNDQTNKQKSALDELKAVYRFSHSFAFIGYGLLVLLLAIIVLMNFRNSQILLYRMGFPFMLTSVLLSIPFVFLLSKANDLFTISSSRFISEDALIDPMLSDATKIVISFARTFTENYSWSMIYVTIGLFVIGIGLIIGSKVMKTKPLSLLDERYDSNI